MENVRWGSAAHVSCLAPFDWLPDALDLRRVKATLSFFPVDDHLMPESCPCGECGCEADFYRLNNRHADSDDIRYSPGFVLPLLFACLESLNLESGSDTVANTSTKGFAMDSLQVMVQRLSDKGSVAFTLASLGCSCSALRRMAVALLEIFTKTLQTAYRGEPTWRERVQISMLLDSVQRGLCIWASRHSGPIDAIPKLPTVSSVFLATACLVLTKPSDDLFVHVNRYFLNSGVDHGAFQDLFRLPAFVSLFCPNTDDHKLAVKQKRFAISLLRDSFVGDDCFRPVSACHALDLLFTAFISPSTGYRLGDETRVLVLDALFRVVSESSTINLAQLIGRNGLLCWIRSVLVGGPVDRRLPEEESRLAFARLTDSAFDAAWRCIPALSSDELREHCFDLMRPIVMVAIYEAGKGVKEHCMRILFRLADQLEIDGSSANISTRGVRITEGLLFLDRMSSVAERPSALIALSRLPIHPHSSEDQDSCRRFCEEAVETLAGEQFDETKGILLLNRVAVIAKLSPMQGVDRLMEKMLLLRRPFHTSVSLCEAWNATFQSLSQCSRSRKDDDRLINQMLSATY